MEDNKSNIISMDEWLEKRDFPIDPLLFVYSDLIYGLLEESGIRTVDELGEFQKKNDVYNPMTNNLGVIDFITFNALLWNCYNNDTAKYYSGELLKYVDQLVFQFKNVLEEDKKQHIDNNI